MTDEQLPYNPVPISETELAEIKIDAVKGVGIDCDTLLDLIARLEAAEAVCNILTGDVTDEETHRTLDAWYAAKG